jgi:hypothetical protein
MDDDKRPMARGRTGNQRRSGTDTRSEKQKERVGERRSKLDRRTGKGSKARRAGKPKTP